MNIQKSFEDETSAVLYVVPTPIGNLEDITYRALNVLKNVAVIAAEDTRNTKNLLHYFEMTTPLVSYHEHNKRGREADLMKRLDGGDSVAIVSDAGMPAISDPGYELVQAAIEREYRVVVLPGANAALCALVGSGLPADAFYFYGFLPRKKKERTEELERLEPYQATLLFYESPYRIKETLKALQASFGNRRAAIARELTKRFEEYVRGTLGELLEWAEQKEMKGEFCLVVEGNAEAPQDSTALWWSSLSVKEHVEYYIEESEMPSKAAIKQVAADRKLSKREVYQVFHVGDE
ncbi:16S rRNA (cytidine(1402)-2'-O)-methyltransferase [Lentibacillus sediminis]|uniref:16S rRNA (cytidine(1402)-2'-O)-methyltransferase n=1 Tax=Lentibacillus sediminis TaxID=1940529 RepID=UPI000C1C6EAA|nr:16S rRNA (cytidine(1402)-2'-O)-methyltransferase [Lentibacillus sediminis]